mgnify:CR=1 FL=1
MTQDKRRPGKPAEAKNCPSGRVLVVSGESPVVRRRIVVAYGTEIDSVKNLLKSIALNNDNVQNEPEPRVRFREFAESGIKLQLLFWIYKPEKKGRTVDAINTEIYKQFKENQISIPYPTMKVLMPEK